MTVTAHDTAETRQSPVMTRFGYSVAIAINALLLFVVNNLLEWDLLPFLTVDFQLVLGLINVSLGFSILINVIFLSFDPAWFKSLAQLVSGGISLVVAVRMYQVFPFDFSGSEFNWTPWARLVLIIGIVGAAIAVLVEMVKLARAVVDT